MAQMMMISHHRERGEYNGPDRVIEYTLAYQCRKNHKFNQWSDDEISDEDFTIVDSLSPSAGPLSSAEQRNRTRRAERSRSRERVYPCSSSHASQQQQPVVPLSPGIQQNLVSQSEDENSATVVGPQNHVSNHSMSPQDQEDARRQGPETPKGRNTAENQPITPQTAKKDKPMDSDEDDEEPQHEPGTSSKSQTTVPVLPLHQGPAASSQGPAASANSGDEDSDVQRAVQCTESRL